MDIEMKSARRGAVRAAPTAAFLWALTAIPVGLWQLLDPEAGPFADPLVDPTVPLPEALPGWVAPAALAVAGLAGLFLARARPRLWPVTAAFAVVFGGLVPSTSVIALIGYLAAFVLPAALVTVPVLLARGRALKLAVAAGVVGVVAALAAAGPLAPSVIGEVLSGLGAGVADLGLRPLAELWSAVGGACWALLTWNLVSDRLTGERAPAWAAPERAARWGRTASYAAFACSLPYGLTRLTWFTPWPFLVPADELDAEPAMRLWGLLLGFACLGGGILCLGMTQRWGERWPYWVPVLRDRPVPPVVAIAPAAAMAYVFTIASVPFVLLGIRAGQAELLPVFPFYVWGPALGAATLAYALRRGVLTGPRSAPDRP